MDIRFDQSFTGLIHTSGLSGPSEMGPDIPFREFDDDDIRLSVLDYFIKLCFECSCNNTLSEKFSAKYLQRLAPNKSRKVTTRSKPAAGFSHLAHAPHQADTATANTRPARISIYQMYLQIFGIIGGRQYVRQVAGLSPFDSVVGWKLT
ncbi:MAG: hypothetical protein ABSE08_03500 [Syntrophobacteraceae bacterium]|jgi:hypothetical protein